MTTKIVRASLEHLNDVADLFDAYRRFYGKESDLKGARVFISERLEQADSVIFLAVRDTKPSGFTQLYPSFSSVSMRPIWILNDLFVEESARHLGVATALMESATKLATETRATRLALETATENHQARALYEKRGWRKNEEFIHYTFELG